MPINRAMRSALRTLSYIDVDLSRNYKHERRIREIASKTPLISRSGLRDRNTTRDFTVTVNDGAPETRELLDFICTAADKEAVWASRKIVLPENPNADGDGSHHVPVRMFIPGDEFEPKPVIIFLHGGGWVVGSIETYDNLCFNLATKTDSIVLCVEYRLAPEYPFPCGLIDCYSVISDVLEFSGRFGINAEDVSIAGDSAGGNLCAAVSLLLRDTGRKIPKSQILLYPATCGTHEDNGRFASIRENGTDYLLTSKRVRDYMGLYMSSHTDADNPYFGPLAAKTFSGQPRTLVVSAEYDPLRDEGEAYGSKLRDAGNYVVIKRMPGVLHGFFSLPPSVFPSVQFVYDLINGFLA